MPHDPEGGKDSAIERAILSSTGTFGTKTEDIENLKSTGPARELAWDYFHSKYAPIIGGFAKKMGVPRAEREDIVQDVLTGFLKALPNFKYDRKKGRFRGFLKVCTIRAIIKRHGKKARWKDAPLDQVDPENIAISQAWEDIWESELLQRALSETKKHYAGSESTKRTFEAFIQNVMRERDAETVANELGIRTGSVYMARLRVTRTLQGILSQLREDIG